MKARIKKTGEIVDVTRNKHGLYVDENRVGYTLNELDFGNEENEHWQEIRERAAIAAMQALIREVYDTKNTCLFAEFVAKDSVTYANTLIKELKSNQ